MDWWIGRYISILKSEWHENGIRLSFVISSCLNSQQSAIWFACWFDRIGISCYNILPRRLIDSLIVSIMPAFSTILMYLVIVSEFYFDILNDLVHKNRLIKVDDLTTRIPFLCRTLDSNIFWILYQYITYIIERRTSLMAD